MASTDCLRRQTIRAGRFARSAFESSGKAALFSKACKKSYLCKAVVCFSQELLGELSARLIQEALEGLSPVGKPPLQPARIHGQTIDWVDDGKLGIRLKVDHGEC